MSLEASVVMSGCLTATERALFDATLALSERLEVADTCDALLGVIERLFDARSTWILLHDISTDELVTIAFRGPGSDAFANVRIPCDRGIVGLAFGRREPVFVPDAKHEDRWFDAQRVHQSKLLSVLTIPLVIKSQAIGIVGLQSPRFSADVPPNGHDLATVRAIAAIAGSEIRNARLHETIEADRGRLERLLRERQSLRGEVSDLRKQVREAHSLDAIVGESPSFCQILAEVELVARADTTVLLVGETGTGKEMIARALHDRSRRSARPFIAINCAALPETLVESELFGYEKGAFTGAFARKPGKFALANHGTLFLDEVGDLPGPAQAKLLRVLQEREVQRVGGTRAEPIDVRLIAATNQDLAAGVQSGSFRTDLFYRLNVFPITLPPLRERPGDIAALAYHFIRRFAERQHKRVPHLSPDALQRLTGYSWPGNVRELQNVVERAIILCRDGVIGPDLISLQPIAARSDAAREAPPPHECAAARAGNVIRFCDAERHAILRALELSAWRISGSAGAADILGLKATTLHAKMKKLGIRRQSGLTRPDHQYSHA